MVRNEKQTSARGRNSPCRRRLPTAQKLHAVRIALLRWYQHSRRDFPWRTRNASLYLRVVSEVLLQRTRAETVASFLPLFAKKFPSWNRLTQASEAEIGRALRPIGLWRRRAKSIRQLALAIKGAHGRWPSDRRELEHMPGVGQYVASAVLLFAYGRPEPLLDSGMARVIERIFGPRILADIRDDPWVQQISRAIVRSKASKEINWALLDLAAKVCQPRVPKCCECPLVTQCRYARGRGHPATTGSGISLNRPQTNVSAGARPERPNPA